MLVCSVLSIKTAIYHQILPYYNEGSVMSNPGRSGLYNDPNNDLKDRYQNFCAPNHESRTENVLVCSVLSIKTAIYDQGLRYYNEGSAMSNPCRSGLYNDLKEQI